MRRAAIAALALFALAGCQARTDSAPEAVASAKPEIKSACEPVIFDDSSFTHCTADPAQHRIVTALADSDGKPFRSLANYAASRPADAPPVAFAMNAGMFDAEGQPIGYFVEDGERLHRLNRADGPGNFHMKPNGVFYGGDGDWHVLDTQSFFDTVKRRPAFGTQSGPMLVVAGELHPDFEPDGDSRKLRNAVGVDRAGRAHFVISDAPVSFGKLARYFRDVLKTPNALFLDGSVSQLWDPVRGRMDLGPALGPLIVVEQRVGTGETPIANAAPSP